MPKTLENCRAVIQGLVERGWRPNGETGASHPTDPACFVWYGTDTFDLYFSPKAFELVKEHLERRPFTCPE